MAKHVYTLGLSEIKMGAIAADGGMGSSLASLGYTYQDTAQMITEDAAVTDFYAEEVDDPVVSIGRAGKIQFKWSLMNPSPDDLETLIGGTASKSDNQLTDNDVWSAPDSHTVIEKSVEITPKQGLKFSVPRAKIEAKINGNLSKSAMLLVEITATVMAPTKSGEKKLKAQIVTAS